MSDTDPYHPDPAPYASLQNVTKFRVHRNTCSIFAVKQFLGWYPEGLAPLPGWEGADGRSCARQPLSLRPRPGRAGAGAPLTNYRS